MSQNNSNEKVAALAKVSEINSVEGFDPMALAVEYTDLSTGEVRKKLPVMAQMAWFRLRYPTGRIAVQATPVKDHFVATARVYPDYRDPVDQYLAEGTASRGYQADKPTISPREWAQTAAVGIALRNAGFGLQFDIAGDEYENLVTNEFGDTPTMDIPASLTPVNTVGDTELSKPENTTVQATTAADTNADEYTATETQEELSHEDRLNRAFQVLCPIDKFKGKTLSEVLGLDPKAIKWLATKFSGDAAIKAAAQLICEHALQQAGA